MKKHTLANFLLAITVASLFLGSRFLVAQDTVSPRTDSPLIGAIRWDAWTSDKGPGAAVEKSLGPERWHYRLPFFAKVIGPNQVEIDGTSQQVMDQEIDYAVQGKIDYWAFVLYRAESTMSIGLNNYLASTKRDKVKFCLVTETGDWANPTMVKRIELLTQEKGYVTVLGGRPVIYLFISSQGAAKRWGADCLKFRAIVDKYKSNVMAAGLKEPYLVVMDFSPTDGKKMLDILCADALSSYNTIGKASPKSSFAEKAQGVQWFWDQCKATGAQVVPIVSTAAGRGPRIENPVPWEKSKPYDGAEIADSPPTPQEVGSLFTNGLQWLKTNQDSATAQMLITYAWNENDEGGWLVPTLTEGTARLDAVAAAVKAEEGK